MSAIRTGSDGGVRFGRRGGVMFGGMGGGAAAPGPVDLGSLTSQSVRLPQINTQASSENAGGACLMFSPHDHRVMAPEHGGAMYMRFTIPWETLYRPSDATIALIGNDNTSSPRRIRVYYKTSGQSNQRKITFTFNGNFDEMNATGTLPEIPKTTRRVLLAFWSELVTGTGYLHVGLWDCDTGLQIGSTVSVNDGGTTPSWLGARLYTNYLLGIGANVNKTTGVYTDSTASNFEIDLFGIYNNGGVALDGIDDVQPDESTFAALALGADPVATFGDNKHLVLRQFRDPSALNDVPTNGEYGLGLTFSPSSTGGQTLLQGGTVARQTDTEYLLVEHIREGKVFAVERSQSSKTIMLTGVTSLADGQQVECRAFSQRDGTVAMDWTVVATVASNAFVASMDCPITKGWAYLEFRAASDPDNVNLQYITRREIGVGYSVRMVGQSQMTLATGTKADAAASGYTSDLTISDIGDAAYSVSRAFSYTNDREATFVVSPLCMPQSDAVLAMGWALDQYSIDAPFEFIVHAAAGTSQFQWVDDSLAGRSFAVDEALSDYLGPEFSAMYMDWITSPASVASADAETILFDEVLLGKTAGTNPVITGTSITYNRDHSVFGNSKDDDVFAVTGKNPIIILGEGTRHQVNSVESPILTTSEPGFTLTNLQQYRGMRQHARSFIANNAEAFAGVPTIDIDLGGVGNNAHQGDTLDGKARITIRFIESILHGMALADLEAPVIQDSLVRSGDTITVTIDMKGKGDLVVGTDLTGVTVPSGYPLLTGWEVSEDGGSTWTLDGFTASILSTTGIVQLVKDGAVDWAEGTLVKYCHGGPASRTADDDDCVGGLLYADTGVNTATDLGKAMAGLLVRGPEGPFIAA